MAPDTRYQAAGAIDERERLLLAPYAFHSCDTAGRRQPEPPHPYRGPFQRDRDRILHSAAFRRLSGKMQVFTGNLGDYHRTRLTHTMEVASIARTIGRVLRLNEDLIEALALLHDIGHPPFGHAGEEVLDECLRDEGGFSHNAFALTLVEHLETRYSRFPGLNLSAEVLAGQRSRIDKSAQSSAPPVLEVQVVDAADSIAYNAHDVDDAIKLGMVTVEELMDVPLAGEVARRVIEQDQSLAPSLLRQAIVHELIDYQVTSLLQRSLQFLAQAEWSSHTDASRSAFRVDVDELLARQKTGLEAYLSKRVYQHEDLVRVRRIAQHQVRELLDNLIGHPERVPARFRAREDEVGLRRCAADYLAGMTDRFCRKQYRLLVSSSPEAK